MKNTQYCKAIGCTGRVSLAEDYCMGCKKVSEKSLELPKINLESSVDPLQVQIGGAHYKGLVIQPIEYIHANGIGFAEGSIIKYVSRWKAKGGIADLEKAKHFIELLIALESKDKP